MTAPTVPPPGTRTLGPERLLLLGYALLVVAAGARSAVQLGTHADRAPVAYTLSALAALVYLAGLLAVRHVARGGAARAARAVAVVELAGVVAVGGVSLTRPALLGEASVWSWFGAGYLFLPLLLPAGVLGWLRGRP